MKAGIIIDESLITIIGFIIESEDIKDYQMIKDLLLQINPNFSIITYNLANKNHLFPAYFIIKYCLDKSMLLINFILIIFTNKYVKIK